MSSQTMEAFPRLSSGLDRPEKRLRHALMNRIIALGRPLNEADIRALGGEEESCHDRILQSLIRKRVVVAKKNQVFFVYPVSALPTAHRVTLSDGRSFHAMCAIDAMGTAFTFEQDVQIFSSCGKCGEPVRVTIHHGELHGLRPAEAHVLHVDLNAFDDWAGSC